MDQQFEFLRLLELNNKREQKKKKWGNKVSLGVIHTLRKSSIGQKVSGHSYVKFRDHWKKLALSCYIQSVQQIFKCLEFLHVNKSCKIERCGNKTHRIIQKFVKLSSHYISMDAEVHIHFPISEIKDADLR